MERIKDVAKFLLDNGLVFEINRRILHPFGLALSVEVDDDDDDKVVFDAVLSIDDEEGWLFDPESFEEGSTKYARFLEKNEERLVKRESKLGYIIQEKQGNNGQSK
jgi:hypothetical protein